MIWPLKASMSLPNVEDELIGVRDWLKVPRETKSQSSPVSMASGEPSCCHTVQRSSES